MNVERKSPNKITVPRLEEFRAPPIFNMQIVPPSQSNFINREKKPTQ